MLVDRQHINVSHSIENSRINKLSNEDFDAFVESFEARRKSLAEREPTVTADGAPPRR